MTRLIPWGTTSTDYSLGPVSNAELRTWPAADSWCKESYSEADRGAIVTGFWRLLKQNAPGLRV